tara:strand:- start:1851 stop:2237 length:387 start_codon:yes stop_codon:yes gene_type:complete
MNILELKILPHQYSIHRLLPDYRLPDVFYKNNSFFSFTTTDDEKSLICESSFDIKDSVRDDRWSCIKLVGQLNVEETGIWSRITSACSNCDCAVLTVTTFNTDYFLIKTIKLEKLRSFFLENYFVFVD